MTDSRTTLSAAARKPGRRGIRPAIAAAGLCGLLSLPAQTLAQTPQVNTPPLDAGRADPAAPPAPAPAQTPTRAQTPAQAQTATKPPSAAASIRMRAGDHPTFTRLVFDWPERVEFAISTEAGKATVRFANPTPVDLGRLPNFPPRGITGLAARVENGTSVVTFGMPEGAGIKSWRDGTKVVLDVSQPSEAESGKGPKAAVSEAKPSEQQSAATPKQTEPKTAEPKTAEPKTAHMKPAAESKSPAEGKSTAGNKPAVQQSPPASPSKSAEAKAPEAPKAAEKPTKPAPAAPEASKAAGPASGVPAAAPTEPVQAAALGTFMPVPPNGPITGEPLVPGVDSSRTGPLLNFPWTRPVAAAAFQRNGNLWLVFNRPAAVDLRPITTRDWNGAINGVEQLPIPGMTVLRLAVPSGTTANFSRRNAGWQVSINTIAPEQLVPKDNTAAAGDPEPVPVSSMPQIDVRRQLDADGGAKLFFAANDPSQPLQVPDPETGDVITVIPYGGANGGVPSRRNFVELSVLPSFQGFALESHADNLEIRRFPRGVEIGTPNGLSLSAPRGADPRSGVTEILRFTDWRNVEGETLREQKENMLRRIALSPPGQRQAARIALAEFFAAHDMHPETLGVLARARAEQPDLERDKLYRALRGVANLGLGRLDEAANDLDSKIFDDDPDVLAYRGALAAEQDDWPSARRAFSLAGAAVARFPPDLRAPLRLTMARAWLAGGDVAAATAEMQALQGDSLTPGQAAEANYVKGLLAEATNKPEEAIRDFDLASGSGDRRARALAEFAKTELMLSRKLIDTAQAIERLDKLRFAWRGGPYEFNLLRRLGELQFAAGDLRSGITTFRQIVKYFPKSPDIPLLSKQMSDEFTKLFLDGGAQSLPPLAALALFYDYRELTPAGPEGDEIISKLADRLVSVDLLNRAAELLEHQVKYRLRGEDRAKTGARLAVVYLLDRNPDAALKALQDTQMGNLSPAVAEERRLLQVRALGDLDRFAEALNLLGQDQSPEARNLRADLYWRAKDWPAFGRVVTQILGNRDADPAALSVDERKQVLKLAVAYSLSNNASALDDLYRKYEPKFRDTPDAAAFTAVASTINRASGDPREMAAAIAQIGQYEAFMSRYRDRVAKGGLSAIN